MDIQDPLLKAIEFENLERFDLAAKEYEKAIQLGVGDQPLVYQGRGRAMAKLGRLEEAVSDLKKALSFDQDLHLAHGILGQIYAVQGKYKSAEQELLTALRLKPDDIIAMASLLHTYQNLERFQEADAICNRMAQLQPETLGERVDIAEMLSGQARYQQAIAQLNHVLLKKPMLIKIYPLYIAILILAWWKYFRQKSRRVATFIVLVPYFVSLLLPSYISVPVGIIVSLFLFLSILVLLWSKKKLNRRMRMQPFSTAFLFYCLIYWGNVCIHYLIFQVFFRKA